MLFQFSKILIVISILITPWFSHAQTSSVNELVRLVIAGEIVPPRLLIKAADERQNAQKIQDDLLKLLLAFPFEQRQYVFPAIFESNLVPQKIRTHPEIAIWKGKVPTDIAPEMKEFSEKYLADLNPRLYMFLAPKSLQIKQPDKALTGSIEWQAMRRKMRPMPTPKGEIFNGYKNIQSFMTLSPELQKNYKATTLTIADITQVKKGFQTISDFLNEQPNSEKFNRSLSLLRTFATDPDEEQINPFQSQVQRIRMMGRGPELDQYFQKAGFQNADIFAQKADKMAKAYRAYHLDIPTALLYHKVRGADKSTLDDAERIIYVQSRMHEASPGDVYFVQSHLSDIYQIFQKAGYWHLLNPLNLLMIDEMNKIGYNTLLENKE